MKKYYFDNEEIGLTKETCHPNFVTNFKEKFYYDIIDDFSPFGNDTGAETLMQLSDWLKENGTDENILQWMFEYIDTFGFPYQSEGVAKAKTLEEINYIEEKAEIMLEIMDQAIISVGFGQIKITGKISDELRNQTNFAIERQILFNKQILDNNQLDINKTMRVVDGITTHPNENGETSELTRWFIIRLEKFKSDLLKFK